MKNTIVRGLVLTGLAAGVIAGASGTASAEKIESGLLPIGQCQALAAQLNAEHAPAPGQTRAGGTSYLCVHSIQWEDRGQVVSRYSYV